jgi:glycosyltransferase involved in cell wall biosynthesis
VQPRALDPVTLAEAIWQLASDSKRRLIMSEAASHSVKERFSLEGYVKRLHDLIENASNQSS